MIGSDSLGINYVILYKLNENNRLYFYREINLEKIYNIYLKIDRYIYIWIKKKIER